jgi:hypothetical protein
VGFWRWRFGFDVLVWDGFRRRFDVMSWLGRVRKL